MPAEAANQNNPDVLHYFVDEAGDTTLFNRRGRDILVGNGASKYFLLGKLEVEDPDSLATDMEALRMELLADPYFKNVPSMQPGAKKTALAFHAKDDRPEVRREVFKLLLKTEHNLKFFAVARDKMELVAYVRQQNERDQNYRYNPNELYDSMVTHLFQMFHHVVDAVDICYAERGNRPRTEAFEAAITKAERVFERHFGISPPNEWAVRVSTPPKEHGLQAVDYFLWALQRFYERQEDGFLELLWPKVSWVHDLDFVDNGRRGIRYTHNKPLNLGARQRKKKRR